MRYDKQLMKSMAENLEGYLDTIDRYAIIQGITEEEYEDAKKTVKKLIKHLKKGNGEKVFDEERYRELVATGKLDDDGMSRGKSYDNGMSRIGFSDDDGFSGIRFD